MELKRYTVEGWDGAGCMVESLDGEWHKRSDVQTLLAERDKRIAELAKGNGVLRTALEKIATYSGETCNRCEGEGELWADGKAHFATHQGEKRSCPDCGGAGAIFLSLPGIAATALEFLPPPPEEGRPQMIFPDSMNEEVR